MTRITGGLRITGNGFNLGTVGPLPVMRWDPAYITNGIAMALDRNNTVVFDIAPGSYTAIATTSIPLTGAYMFTVRMDFNIDAMVPDIGGYVGFGNRNFNSASNIGSDVNSIGFSDTGLAFFQNAVIATDLPTFNTNTTRIIDVAVLNNSYIWIRVDGGDWNNNASSNLLDGTGGLSDLGTAGFTELYPMVTVAGDLGPTEFKILPTSPYGIPSDVTFVNMAS